MIVSSSSQKFDNDAAQRAEKGSLTQDGAARDVAACHTGLKNSTAHASKPVQSSQKKFRSDTAFVVVSRVVGIGATMAGHMLAGRWLGPENYGHFLLISTVIALGSIFAMRGLNEAGLRFIAESLAKKNGRLASSYLFRIGKLLSISSFLTVAVFAIGMVLFHMLIRPLESPVWLIALTSGGIVFLAWQQVSAESLRGYGELKLASLYSGGQTGGPVSNLVFLSLFALTILVASQVGLVLAVTLLVVAVMLTIPFALKGLWKTSNRAAESIRQPAASENKIDVQDFALDNDSNVTESEMNRSELSHVGWVLMLNQILAFGTYQFDIWLGGALLDGAELGYYGAARRALLLVSLPLQMAMMAVLPVVPRMWAQNRKKELERFLRSTATFAAVPSMIALALLLFFPKVILSIVFGAEFVAAAPIALVMIIGHVVMIVSGNPPYILAMTGQQKTVVYVNLIAALAMAIFGSVGAWYFGGVGLAIGCSASLIAQHGLLWWMARQKLGIWTHLGTPILSTKNSVDIS